jgi:hypothetical protein
MRAPRDFRGEGLADARIDAEHMRRRRTRRQIVREQGGEDRSILMIYEQTGFLSNPMRLTALN